jgi:hypothetical protein
MVSKKILSSNPPDVGADLVASQVKRPVVPVSIQGGGMLSAIKNRTASLRAMLNTRKRHS